MVDGEGNPREAGGERSAADRSWSQFLSIYQYKQNPNQIKKPPRAREIFAIIKRGRFDFVETEALGRDSTIWKSTGRVADEIDSKSLLCVETGH